VASLLKAPATDLVPRVEKLLEELRATEQELAALRAAQRGEVTSDLTERAREVAGVRVVSSEVAGASAEELHAMVDELRARLGSGVVLLAATAEGRVSLALGVTRDLTGQLRAGDLVREVAAAVGGKGGGRPDFARAGGNAPERLDEAFARLDALVAEARG
jgi:alanyl-tRNA synthetase